MVPDLLGDAVLVDAMLLGAVLLGAREITFANDLGRALMNSEAGDSVVLQLPGGTENLTALEVRYERISVEPFREPAGSEARSEASAKRLPRRR